MKKLLSLLLVVLVLLPANLVIAQDSAETQPIELPNGQTVEVGTEWAFEDQDGLYVFTRDDESITLILPENTAPYYADSVVPPTAAELLLILSAEEVIPHAISENNIVLIDNGAEYTYIDGLNYGEVQVLAWDDGFVYQEIVAEITGLKPLREVTANLLMQLGHIGAMMPQIEIPDPGAAAECFVSTENNWGAAMRLGPSYNRGEYTSLMPADGEVLVLAQNVDDSGGIWWRVEENYDAVAELWVNDGDVISSGNCAMVGEEAGQGLVIPVGPPPPPAPANPADPAAPAAPADPGQVNTSLIPRSGTWSWTESAYISLNCQGAGSVQEANPDAGRAGTIYLTASADGTSVIVNDGPYTYNFVGDGNGAYQANTPSFIPNAFEVMFLRVTSPTSMSIEVAIGFTDMPCSGSYTVVSSFIG